MAGTKIKLKDQLGRVVRVGGDATKGATVGHDLRWPDGSLVQESQVRNATGGASTGGSTGGLPSTVWKLIREVPANLQKLAALAGVGFTTRGADGEWHQRSITAGEGIDVENPDGVGGNPEVALAELPTAVGGTLQKITRDAYGRVSELSPAALADLDDVSDAAPALGDLLQWDGAQWKPNSVELGVLNLDGGNASSVYGGTTGIDGGNA